MECFRKKQFFVTFRVCYMRNNLACLGGYLTHLDVADMSNLFYFHFVFTWSSWWRAFRDPIQPAWRDGYANAYVPIYINKELHLFWSRCYEQVFSLARWNRFYINTEPARLSGYFFHTNTQLEKIRHLKNFLYTSYTFSVLL